MCSEDFVATDGHAYTIRIDDSGSLISVSLSGEELGTISLRLIEGDYPTPDIYHITHLALGGCTGRGIGRRCLQFHKEVFRSPLSASDDDGMVKDDGSHLTEGGPGFIAKMRAEGIVMNNSRNHYDDDE